MPSIPTKVQECDFYKIYYTKHICISNVDCKQPETGFDNGGIHNEHYLNLSNLPYKAKLYKYIGDARLKDNDKIYYGFTKKVEK